MDRMGRFCLGQLLLALTLLLTLGFGPSIRTEAGHQCPTAPQQTISEAVRNCCGHVIGHRTRALKPGDKGFVQCRCAEKAAVQVKIAGAPVQLLLPSDFILDWPLMPRFRQAQPAYSLPLIEGSKNLVELPPDA